jgi:hypothetical protein
MEKARAWLFWIAGLAIAALITFLLDGVTTGFGGWLSYFALFLLGAGTVFLAWKYVVLEEKPAWLITALAMAFLLRIGVGVALFRALPLFGYDEEPQRAGYVFYDAYRRDRDAWTLGRSDAQLTSAFQDPGAGDQYGGLSYISAALYRYLPVEEHNPVFILTLTSAASAMAVLFSWGFTKRLFGEEAGKIAAWLVALYPELVLLGSSQMREPFLAASLAVAFYGYALIRDGLARRGVAAIVLGILVLALPISPPFALAILALVILAWLWESRLRRKQALGIALSFMVLGAAAAFLLIQTWANIGQIVGSPLEIIFKWWENVGGNWRLTLVEEQSALIDYVFGLTPGWSHLPLLVTYGLVQPLLPASLTAPGAAIWRVIAIWRSAGWFMILPFLIYAPFAAYRARGVRSISFYLSFMVWVTAVLVSYRAAGYQWDNPRYRAIFLAIEAAVVAWAWVHAKKERDPWLGRTVVLVGIFTLGLLQWYAGRYFDLPRLSLPLTIAITVIIAALFLGYSWIRDRKRAPGVRVDGE